MARWSEVTGAMNASKVISLAPANLNPVALISTLIFFAVCITMLLALCAAHSNHHPQVLNARRDFSSEPDLACALAIAPPEQFVKSKDPSPGDLSFRFSSSFSSGNIGTINSRVIPKLSSAGAAINKLGSSFRIRSFRDSSVASSRGSTSFRISTSFRMDSSCKQADVVDALRRARDQAPGPDPEEDHSSPTAEPAVWQRVILRGERCAPLSFSGLILYDENGNLLPPSFSEDESTKQPVREDPQQQQQQQEQQEQQPTMIHVGAAGTRTVRHFGSASGSSELDLSDDGVLN